MKSQLLLLMILATLSAACGRSNKVYPGTQQPVTVGESALPEDFFDQSVNQASVELALDGVSETSLAFEFKTSQSTNSQGSFNGSGTGNRALLGISKFAKTKISDLGTVTFDEKSNLGSEEIKLLLAVDLSCDGATIRVLKADEPSSTAVDHGYSRVTINTQSTVWTISGATLLDPNDSSKTLVSSQDEASLDAFISAYPSACITNAATNDDSLPKNIPTAGVLFALGDDSTATSNSVFVNRITIGSETFKAYDRRNP